MTDQSPDKRAQLAGRLREARKLAGLSQGQVAKAARVASSFRFEIEAGNRRVSSEELSKLAELYDVSVLWLLGEVADTLDATDPKLQLAARELSKLKPEDLERLLKLLAAMRDDAPDTKDA